METNLTTGKPVEKFAPICVWCNAPWSDANVRLEISAGVYCSTCGPEVEGSVEIVCHACNRLMYRKDY